MSGGEKKSHFTGRRRRSTRNEKASSFSLLAHTVIPLSQAFCCNFNRWQPLRRDEVHLRVRVVLRDATSSRGAGGGAAPRGIADGGTPEALPEGESRVIAVVVVVGGVASVSVLDLRGQPRPGEGRTAGGVGEDAEEEGCIQYQDSCSELQRRLQVSKSMCSSPRSRLYDVVLKSKMIYKIN